MCRNIFNAMLLRHLKMSNENLENIINSDDKKHSDQYYLNKELLIGTASELCGFMFGAYASSGEPNSEGWISLWSAVGGFAAFNLGYLPTVYFDRRKNHDSFTGFAKYVAKMTALMIPAGICSYMTKCTTVYALQQFVEPAYLAAGLSWTASTAVFFGVVNLSEYVCATKAKKVLKSQTPSS